MNGAGAGRVHSVTRRGQVRRSRRLSQQGPQRRAFHVRGVCPPSAATAKSATADARAQNTVSPFLRARSFRSPARCLVGKGIVGRRL